jgi:universal stress protein E
MKNYQSLLVFIQHGKDKQPALSRAIELAKKTQGKITAFLSVYNFSYDLTSIVSTTDQETMRQAIIKEKTAWLNELIQSYKNDIDITVEVQWHASSYEAIIDYAHDKNFDLIIKATQQEDGITAVIFTPTDWHIIRKSDIPVLMVKSHAWQANGHIICALDVLANSDEHKSLNTQLIQSSQNLGGIIGATVHLVNSYPGTPINIAIELPDFDVHAYNEAIKTQHEQRTLELATQHKINANHCHVREGLPDDIIPEVAKKIDAQLVILGTSGRTGISAALIGNTAEHVIDSLNCDLLTIKYCE